MSPTREQARAFAQGLAEATQLPVEIVSGNGFSVNIYVIDESRGTEVAEVAEEFSNPHNILVGYDWGDNLPGPQSEIFYPAGFRSRLGGESVS